MRREGGRERGEEGGKEMRREGGREVKREGEERGVQECRVQHSPQSYWMSLVSGNCREAAVAAQCRRPVVEGSSSTMQCSSSL